MDSSPSLICSWVAAISFLTILATLLFMVYKKIRSVTASSSPPNWKHHVYESYCEPSLDLLEMEPSLGSVEMEPSLDSYEGNMDNCESEQRLEAFISRFNSELGKQRQEHIITNENLKEKKYIQVKELPKDHLVEDYPRSTFIAQIHYSTPSLATSPWISTERAFMHLQIAM